MSQTNANMFPTYANDNPTLPLISTRDMMTKYYVTEGNYLCKPIALVNKGNPRDVQYAVPVAQSDDITGYVLVPPEYCVIHLPMKNAYELHKIV